MSPQSSIHPALPLPLLDDPLVGELDRIEEHCSPPIREWTDNTVIDALVLSKHEVVQHTVTFYRRFGEVFGSESFIPLSFTDWQLRFERGFLDFRFVNPETLILSAFYLFPEHQNKGHGKNDLNRLCNELFVAGAEVLLGRPAQTIFETVRPMSSEELTKYYLKHCGFERHPEHEGWIIKRNPFHAPRAQN